MYERDGWLERHASDAQQQPMLLFFFTSKPISTLAMLVARLILLHYTMGSHTLKGDVT